MNQQQIETYEWEHKHGGNGWCVIQLLPNEYCHVTQAHEKGFGKRAYLAWTKKLSPEMVHENPNDINCTKKIPVILSTKLQSLLKTLRDDLGNGRAVIKSTHVYRV